MRELAEHLRSVVGRCVPLLLAISDEHAARRPAPGKWSPKQVLGHLIDSACNNQQKFVRLLHSGGHVDFAGYDQDRWVDCQHYQDADWRALVELWRAYNAHLAHVIASADPACLAHTIAIDGKGPFRLDFVMADYVEHMKHHLRALLPDAGLASSFENVYGA